jgi:DNA-directed RNA polymerase subunit K/omega
MTDKRSPKELGSASIYEKAMVAAKEARRLNNRVLSKRVTPGKKVTTAAIERVQKGEVEYRVEERKSTKADAKSSFFESVGEESDGEWTS